MTLNTRFPSAVALTWLAVSMGPVLIISGFDRRVLESAFRLGAAQGLNMVGPLEKPVRLEELEDLLRKLKPVVSS